MSALLERKGQAISSTDIARSTKDYLDRLESGEEDRYVVMRKNSPAAVLLGVDTFETLVEQIEDLRVEIVALQRLANFEEGEAITHDDMRARFK